MALEPSKYFTPITAWFAGITAFIAALAAVLNAFGTLDLSPIVNIFRGQSYAIAVIDAEYAVSRDASYWSDVDITEAPVGRIEAGNFVRVRGLIKDYELYMIELSSVEIAFVSKHNLIEADTYRQETSSWALKMLVISCLISGLVRRGVVIRQSSRHRAVQARLLDTLQLEKKWVMNGSTKARYRLLIAYNKEIGCKSEWLGNR